MHKNIDKYRLHQLMSRPCLDCKTQPISFPRKKTTLSGHFKTCHKEQTSGIVEKSLSVIAKMFGLS